jgi:hypothetical protein
VIHRSILGRRGKASSGCIDDGIGVESVWGRSWDGRLGHTS